MGELWSFTLYFVPLSLETSLSCIIPFYIVYLLQFSTEWLKFILLPKKYKLYSKFYFLSRISISTLSGLGPSLAQRKKCLLNISLKSSTRWKIVSCEEGGGRRLVFHRVAYNSCMFQKVNTKSHGHLTACSRIYNKCVVFTASRKELEIVFVRKPSKRFRKYLYFSWGAHLSC